MTRILTIIALLFATPAWAETVDGNSFYCKPKDNIEHLAIIIEDGLAVVITADNKPDGSKYELNSTTVWWSSNRGRKDGSGVYFLDRVKLTLDYNLILNVGMIRDHWQCELMEFKKARKLVIEKTRESRQF
jgi:hypothetical protein